MRPTREEYKKFVEEEIENYFGSDQMKGGMRIMAEKIYQKYLSDPNSVETPEKNSE